MEIREGSRRRNNKIIFITAGVIFLLIILSMQTQPTGKVLKISVGDSSYEVANMLTREGVTFKPLSGEVGGGIVVDYTPVSALDRLDRQTKNSRYEIRFDHEKVVEIVWLDANDKERSRLLFIKIVAVR